MRSKDVGLVLPALFTTCTLSHTISILIHPFYVIILFITSAPSSIRPT